MAVFHCPGCNYLKTVADKHLGKSADCPKCESRGLICEPQNPLSPKNTDKPPPTVGSEPISDSSPHVPNVPAWYTRAQNVNEGMYRFHKYSKLLLYKLIGFALWANDLADTWVGFLCNLVDNATQSTLWSCTAGLFMALPAISPMYRTYNLLMTVVTIGFTVWASRWYFHTMLMTKAKAAAMAGHAGSLKQHTEAIVGEAQTLFFWWLGEYFAGGVIANLLFRAICPISIPWYPTFTAWVIMGIGFSTVIWFKEVVLTQDPKVERPPAARKS